jgi:hypothetical protein
MDELFGRAVLVDAGNVDVESRSKGVGMGEAAVEELDGPVTPIEEEVLVVLRKN